MQGGRREEAMVLRCVTCSNLSLWVLLSSAFPGIFKIFLFYPVLYKCIGLWDTDEETSSIFKIVLTRNQCLVILIK